MPSQATVTAVAGPAKTVTSLVLTGLKRFELALDGKSMLFTQSDQGYKEFDIAATATLTCTIASGVATIVVNQ